MWFQIGWLTINLKENDTCVSSTRRSKRAEKWANGVVSVGWPVGVGRWTGVADTAQAQSQVDLRSSRTWPCPGGALHTEHRLGSHSLTPSCFPEATGEGWQAGHAPSTLGAHSLPRCRSVFECLFWVL